jgi:hypothetical protein
MAKMLKSRHTGVMFGYDPTMAANTQDYEVIEDTPPKKRRRRTAKPKATAKDTPPKQTELDLDVDGLIDELDDS